LPLTRVITDRCRIKVPQQIWPRTVLKSVRRDDSLRLINDVRHINLSKKNLVNHVRFFQNITVRTPTTWEAPAFAANILKIPVPHPTSKTVFPWNKCELSTIADRYEPVRTVSFNISSWIPAKTVFSGDKLVPKNSSIPKCAYESA
jgi:hypothetical protein